MSNKFVVWDVDGPINFGVPESHQACYGPSFRNPAIDLGEDPIDFTINNLTFLKLSLEILHKNQVESIIGSQRIQMQEHDPYYGKYVKAMYGALDHFFGKERPYLKEDVAREVGAILGNEETNGSKNKLISIYQDKFRIDPADIIFIDDHDNYRQPAEDAGYTFVYAPRRALTGSVTDNAYLYETLLRAVPVAGIYKAMDESQASKETKKNFKKQLLDYQFTQLTQVAVWQKKLLIEEAHVDKELLPQTLFSSHEEPGEQAIKQVLRGLQYLIVDSKWDIGLFGGVKIIDNETGEGSIIPKGMSRILEEITAAQKGSQSWEQTLLNVEVILISAADKKTHGFFNARGETTQLFYDKAKQAILDLREQFSDAPIEDEFLQAGPSNS